MILLFPAVLLFAPGCTKDVGSANPGRYPGEVAAIVANRCATSGCHNDASANAAAGLNLSSWEKLFAGSVNGSPVIPYNSRFSSLCYFINTYPDLGLVNVPTMPLNGEPLSWREVQAVKDWVDAGAPDAKGRVMWADNPRRPKLYAVNQGCDVVTVFDAESRLPMRYIDVGTRPGIEAPHHIRVSPDGNYWYVIFLNNNIMQKFRCSDDRLVGNIPLTPLAAGSGAADANDWNTFVITADGKKAYCASWSQNGAVCAVDLERMKLLKYVGGQHYPHAIALNAAEDKVYIGAQTGNFITALDTSLLESGIQYSLENGVAPTTLPSVDPHYMLRSANGREFWITCIRTNDVRVFSLETHSVTAVIPAGRFPQEIEYSPAQRAYYVSCMRDSIAGRQLRVGSVMRIDEVSKSAMKIPVGHLPHGIAIDEQRQVLYVLSRNIGGGGPVPHHSSACAGNNGFVEFINLHTNNRIGSAYELSVDPYFIYYRP